MTGTPRNPVLRAIGTAGVFAVTAVVYWPGLNGPLILDDAVNLDILRVLSEQGALSIPAVVSERGGLLGGRPLSWTTFVLNWHVVGADVWSFKLVNLLLHVANGALVLALTRRLLASAVPTLTEDQRWWSALAVTGFWLLAPIQISSVLYVVQRMTLLATFFCLLGLLLYCSGRAQQSTEPRSGALRIALAILVCWPLAVLSKQNGILLAPLILLIELTLLSPRESLPRPARAVLLCTALGLAGAFTRIVFDPGWLTHTYEIRDFTMTQRLLTQPRVLVDYALNVLQFPGGSPLGLFHDDFPVSTGALSPVTTPFAALLCVVIVVAAWRFRGLPVGLPFFGLTFFLVAHSLEAGPFPLEIYFEHRNYLPSFGLWLSAVSSAVLAARALALPRFLPPLALVTLLGHAFLAFNRVDVWTSWEGIVLANAHAHPASARARAGAAIVAFQDGDTEAGIEHLDTVRRLLGEAAEAPIVLKTLVGHCLSRKEPSPDVLERMAELQRLESDPYTLGALQWYRTVVTTMPCPGLATALVARQLADLADARRDARRYGREWELHDEIARLLTSSGQQDRAQSQLRRALTTAPASRRPELRRRLRLGDGTRS